MRITTLIQALVLCNLIAGCSTTPFVATVDMVAEFKKAPVITPFYDDYWLLLDDLVFDAKRKSDGKLFTITIPAGFVTDLASIPSPLNAIFDKSGRYSSAGILHDYLYWTQFCDRKKSDRMIKEGLKASDSKYFPRNTIKYGVYWFGWAAWSSNENAKAKGEERFVPLDKRRFPSQTKWADYKKTIDKDIAPPWTNPEVKQHVQRGCEIFDGD